MNTVVYFWRIRRRFIPLALLFMAINKLILKRVPGVSFIKLLGTGKGETFTPKDADALRWGLLVTVTEESTKALDTSKVING